MNRVLTRALVAVAVLLASTGLAIPAQAATLTVTQYEAQIAALVNQARADKGLSPLVVSASITSVARNWSGKMASSGTFEHNPSYASQMPSGWTTAAENIAYGAVSNGQYPASTIHANFMASSGHRANILNSSLTHLGVGVAFVTRNGFNYVYVTEDFGRYPNGIASEANNRTAERLAGPTRYETAVAIGKQAFPSSDEVVVVAGSQASVVDGLVAAPFAYYRKAPVLLTERTQLGATTRAEIKRRAPSRAWVIGGTGVVSSSVESELKSLGVSTVTRLAGSDRYATAAAVAVRMPANSKAIIASGNTANLIDAAAASGPAAAAGQPILLAARNDISKTTQSVLRSRHITRVTLVGGSDVLGSGVTKDLNNLGIGATRLAGSDRYGTAAAVASGFKGFTGSEDVLVAGGRNENLIDAMTGGTLGMATLLASNPVAGPTLSWVSSKGVDHLVVVGGTDAVGTASVITLKSV
jgi:putative cell wall-binding protein/uncharacterized protein YkwD